MYLYGKCGSARACVLACYGLAPAKVRRKLLSTMIMLSLPLSAGAQIFDLDNLDGNNGFAINGIDLSDNSGIATNPAGDVNNDGISDVIIGANLADPDSTSTAGESYVVFGSNAGFTTSIELSALSGADGLTLPGNNINDISGTSVDGIGDFNGDLIEDFMIGAPLGDPPSRSGAGESFIVFGTSLFSAAINLANLDGSDGLVLNGVNIGDRSGGAVSGAGDVNGDGVADVLVGANLASSLAGAAYVVFGRDTSMGGNFGASLELSTLDGGNGFKLSGANAGDGLGIRVSGAGDINHDGVDDFMLAARNADPAGRQNAGQVYVVFGDASAGAFAATVDVSNLDGSDGFVINGAVAGDLSGESLAAAGDVNNDGIDDLIIGATGADTNPNDGAGSAYVIFGRDVATNPGSAFAAELELSALNGSDGFSLRGINIFSGSAGRSVGGSGDVNGDNIDDIVIGADGAGVNGATNAGVVYVVYGSSDLFPAVFDLGDLDGDNGFAIIGTTTSGQSGFTASIAGDVNDDLLDDILLSAPSTSPNGVVGAGTSYVVFGFVPGISPVLILPGAQTLNEDQTVLIPGIVVSDLDSSTVNVNLDVVNGMLAASNRGSIVITGNGTASLEISGLVIDVNQALGNLMYIPFPDDNGNDTLSVRVTDPSNQSDMGNVPIIINAVNDPPIFATGPNQMSLNDGGVQTVFPWASGLSGGPSDESQNLTFIVTANSNPGIFAQQPVVAGNGELQYSPAPLMFGTASITLLAMDSDGTANGGMDTSLPQGFNIEVISSVSADLSVSVGNGSGFVDQLQVVSYTIQVSNNGPDNVLNAVVNNPLPIGFDNVTWSCTAVSGADCTPAGTDGINDLVDIPVGSLVTYLLTGTVTAAEGQTVTNFATVTAPADVPDLVPGNNSDIDIDVVGLFADSFEND